jgi:hypothetical protein
VTVTLTYKLVVLGGIVASVLEILPKASSKADEGDGFLRTIKIRSTPSFRGEVKPEAPSHKILRHVKNPFDI